MGERSGTRDAMDLVLSGIGAVFPMGFGGNALLRALRDGLCLSRPSERLGGAAAAEIGEGLKQLVPRKGLTALSRSALLAAATIESLIQEVPGLLPEKARGECALVVGTAFGHVASKSEFHAVARRDGVRLVSPILFPNTIVNSLAGHAAILHGLSGPNSTVTSGRRSSLEALLRAGLLLRAGRAERAIVLGVDEVSPALLNALAGAGTPGGASAGPWFPGEAGVALLVEPAGSAEAQGRGARARIMASAERSAVRKGLSAAVREAMEAVLEDAGLRPEGVAWLSLSAGGRIDLDGAELAAAREVFGPAKPCAALKAVFGETFGAAGALSAAAAAISLEEGIIPATARARDGLQLGDAVPGISPRVRLAPPGPVLLSAVEEDGATVLLLSTA